MIGNKNLLGHKHSEETKAKIGEATRNLFKDEDYCRKWSQGMTNLPNKLETFFNEVTPKEVKYTGDGKFFLTFEDGTVKNPDFVVDHSRKVIELYGDYWHRDDNPQDLINQYAKINFDCLVIWESEIKSDLDAVLRRVDKFIKLEN